MGRGARAIRSSRRGRALTPITVAEAWPRELRGITLPDVAVRIIERNLDARRSRDGRRRRPSGDAVLASRRGSLLFTHFGLSGPVVLDVSRVVSGHAAPRRLTLELDLVPACEAPAFADFLRQRLAEAGKRLVASLVPDSIPRRLVDQVLVVAEIAATRKAAELTRDERNALAAACKRLPLAPTGTLGFKKAEVTAGGVALAEVDSRTAGEQTGAGPAFCRRGFGSRWPDRRLQLSGRLEHWLVGGRQRVSSRGEPTEQAAADRDGADLTPKFNRPNGRWSSPGSANSLARRSRFRGTNSTWTKRSSFCLRRQR